MMAQPKIDRRGWQAWFLQKRRRSRLQSGPVPNAPVIVSGGSQWNAGNGNFDVWIGFTFDPGGFPVASIEVWYSRDGGGFGLLATIGSSETQYFWAGASWDNCSFDFKIRYVNGGVVGPFSNVWHIEV